MQENNHLIHWLKGRHITDEVITQFNIHVGTHALFGECLVIPIEDTGLNKYRRDPLQQMKPKYISDQGLHATLYGAKHITDDSSSLLITEGELDCLVAWSANIPAITSTTGALSFQEEWLPIVKKYDVYICFDNDDAGAQGMVKTLKMIPNAKIVLIPEQVGIKDISDFVEHGGDLHALLQTANSYESLVEVQEDRAQRKAQFQSVRFHDAYIESCTAPHRSYVKGNYTYTGTNVIEKAKSVPLTSLIEFRMKKTCCIFHNEKTASMQYYPATNSAYCFGCGKYADAITVVRHTLGLTFKEAVIYLNTLI